MGSLFDRLEDQLNDRDKKGGLSPIDLLDLPEEMRKIMRQLLRAGVMSRQEIADLVQSWPENDRIDEEELDKSLDLLLKQSWLIRLGEGEIKNYRANLKRKAARKLDDSIWNAIDTQIAERKTEDKDE